MNRLKVTYKLDSFGDYGEVLRKRIILQCSFKYKIFGKTFTHWEDIYHIYENDLPDIKNEKELLNVMVDLWMKKRKETLNLRIKEKVLNNLEYK
jgi:hypothetical protein